MARDGPRRASLVQAGVRIHGWAQAERGGGVGPESGSRSGFRAAAAPAAASKQPARRQQQVKPTQQQQSGGTVDALIVAPVASVAPPVASPVVQVAASVAPVNASVAATVASDAPVAAPVVAQLISLIQSQSTMLSEHSAKIQDLQRQLQLQDKHQLQFQQQHEDVVSQLQHQLIQIQEEVQGNSRGQLRLDHAVRTCQRQLGQRRTQTPATEPARHAMQALQQSVTQDPVDPQSSVQPPAQCTAQQAAQPQQPQSQLSALIPSWARLQQPSPAAPAQQPPTDVEEAPNNIMVVPEEQERRKRSANVVMYGLSGNSPACLRQAAQEVFQALNLPHAGQHVVAVESLPTQGPHPPVIVRFDDPCWSARLLRSKRSLRRLPALARVYIAEHLTRTQQAEKIARQPRYDAAQQLGHAFWRGTEVMLHRRDAIPGSAPEVFAC